MNKTTGIILAIVVLAGVVGIAYASMRSNVATDAGMDKDAMMKDDSMMEQTESMKDEKMGMMAIGSYEAYAPEKLAKAEAGDVVLFFHASWCPSCRGLNADIEENMSAIPEGVTILKVDYDTESELKAKYGVTNQHTLVQVAADGSLIKMWSGSPSLARLVTEIN